jgi:phage shock protein PspC (stress-responsive transcriptional regulator)
MEKVVTINLNGHAYQLDEAAYDALRAYLQQAEVRLKDNPDRVEILADLERAIAEKCTRFLGPQKTVVGAAEMDEVVKEMGPVEGTDGTSEDASTSSAATGAQPGGRRTPRRLYRIREGQMVGGVCNGLAAYFGVDPTLVRIPFLLLLWIGIGGLAYIALMIVVPYADTPEEQAAASGQPFNAQELIDSIKRHTAEFKDHGNWKREWRTQQRRWRAEHRAWRQQFRHTMRERRWWGPAPPPPGSYPGQAWAGLLMPIFSLVNLAFFALLAVSILSLVNTGGLYGWSLPNDVPLWAGIVILVVLYHAATSPIRAARHASYHAWGQAYGWLAIWDGLIATGAMIFLGWLLLTHMPPVDTLRDFVQNLPGALQAIARDVSTWFRDLAERAR